MASGRRRRRRRTISNPATPPGQKPVPVPAQPKGAAPEAVAPKVVKPKPAGPAKPKPVAAKPRSRAAGPAKPAERSGAVKAKAVADPLIGTTLGRCRIEERVGAGRTAVVYRAHYEALDQTVALKVLQPETAAIPELVERFESEARAIAKIDNENVLKIYDVGREGDKHYMVVELLEGEEIMDLIEREGQVEPTDALRIIRQAANGLAAAHAKGIIHRDVKPQNLFLLEDGTVKVVDFGLAARYSDSSQRVGTPHYMAPEVCESGNADLGSDVYALGIVLYHLLVGQPPYAGMSIQEILRAHIQADPLRPEQHVKRLDRDVAELVRELTKSDPLVRPGAPDILPLLDKIGGKELKEKASLRGRRRRGSRSRAAVVRRERQARKGAMPLVLAGLGAAVIVGAILAMTTGEDEPAPKGTDTPPSTPTVGSTPEGRGPTFQGPDAESPEVILARERAKEQMAKEAAARQRETDARAALERAEAKAREVWKSEADTDAVLSYYRSVSSRFKKTAAAKEAKDRIREIKDGKRHPHPDRRFSTIDAVEAAKRALANAVPSIEADIGRHEYDAANAKVPGIINDASGRLASEIQFLQAHTRRLAQFKRSLIAAVRKALAKKEALRVQYDGREGLLEGLSERLFQIKQDGKMRDVTWADMPNQAIATLAETLLGTSSANVLLQQMAFAFAHGLEDAFWTRELELSSSKEALAQRRVLADYTKRWESRASKK